MANILVVEDDENWREILTQALQLAGYTVTTAEDGVQAFKMLGIHKFDVVILDLNLPRLNGVEAVRLLRRTDGDLPVLAITANADPQLSRAVVEAGANDILIKPLNTDAVIEIVAGYARQKP